MHLIVNGKPRTVADQLALTELIEQLQLKPQDLVVELNQQILASEQLTTTVLHDGDQLELIQFVGGG